jgi:hypothetical protein
MAFNQGYNRKGFKTPANTQHNQQWRQQSQKQVFTQNGYFSHQMVFCASVSAGYGFNPLNSAVHQDARNCFTSDSDDIEMVEDTRPNWRMKQLFSGRPPVGLHSDGRCPQSDADGFRCFPGANSTKNAIPHWKRAKMVAKFMRRQMAEALIPQQRRQREHFNGQWAKVYISREEEQPQTSQPSGNNKKKRKQKRNEVIILDIDQESQMHSQGTAANESRFNMEQVKHAMERHGLSQFKQILNPEGCPGN